MMEIVGWGKNCSEWLQMEHCLFVENVAAGSVDISFVASAIVDMEIGRLENYTTLCAESKVQCKLNVCMCCF